jgi:hypothetical protein
VSRQVRVMIREKDVIVTSFDPKQVDLYDTVDDLPQWMQERIATLMVVGEDAEVEGVGVFWFKNIFWIDVPNE